MLSLQWLNASGKPLIAAQNISSLAIPASLRFDEDTLLKVTQQHMAQRNYQSALSAAELVLRAHPDNARARRLADQASELLRASAVYGGFLRAADQQDSDTAAALYAELPSDSPFRVNAWEPFLQVRSLFMSRHLSLGNAALAAGDCDLVSQQLDELHKVADNDHDPDLVQGQRMLTRCRRSFGSSASAAASPSETSSGAEAAGPPEPEAQSELLDPFRRENSHPRETPKSTGADSGTHGKGDIENPLASESAQQSGAVAAPKPHKAAHKKAAPKAAGAERTGTDAAPPDKAPEKSLPAGLRNPFGP
jgi:hypothetical protein